MGAKSKTPSVPFTETDFNFPAFSPSMISVPIRERFCPIVANNESVILLDIADANIVPSVFI